MPTFASITVNHNNNGRRAWPAPWWSVRLLISGSGWSTFYVLTTTVGGTDYYYPHFMDKKQRRHREVD